ncbi:MAG TPA: 30S ribosomal protein S20 [Parachlamydiaceae bacterium]|nr:30S ribosomal protein S20 [Parachlamydiaceae bacterium]
MAKEKEEVKKVKRPTALKRDIQNEKRRLRNKAVKSQIRTAIRNFDEALPKGEPELVKEKLNLVYSLMDKGVKKGVVTINKASRTKSRLAARSAAKK